MTSPGQPAAPHDALPRRLAELGAQVDAWTREILASVGQPPAERFGQMLEYHLGWRDQQLAELPEPAPSGKKLRPALVLLVCEATCGSIEPARGASVAVELVHNFSLVHDDIQDRSELRRHRPTLWWLWTAEQAINAGDALFALAQLAALAGPSRQQAAIVEALNVACLRLVEGQYLDLELQRGSLPAGLDLYEGMIDRKTGALFAAACRLGALAGGAAPETQELYATYGAQLGRAFQEQDDLLGIWGAEADTGKPAASDVLTRKKGLPAVLALMRPDAPAWLQAAYAASAADMPADLVRRTIAHFDGLGLREAIERRVRDRYQEARAALEAAGAQPPARHYLEAICESLVARRT